ncbi:MAG: Protein of unknown function (DUF3035) [Pelagibacterales bacterium]|nr:Protein of unknown function (DUF3035) [Pelagibacterales bacterium]
MKLISFCKILFLGLLLFLISCQSVKDGLTGQKKSNSDEFLVQKKNPLVQPPNYGELPTPTDKKVYNEESIDNEIEKLLGVYSEDEDQSNENNNSNDSIETSILKKINNN